MAAAILKEVYVGLLDLLYPPRCILCSAAQTEPFCADCAGKIHPSRPPYCDRCGYPVSANEELCGSCIAGQEPPYAWAQAMGEFTGPLREAIHQFKYNGKTALAAPLGKLLAQSLDSPKSPLLTPTYPDTSHTVDLIVPVPLHRSRFKRRGYNQAELLARVIAREKGWELDTKGLIRIRHTQTQTALRIAERASNVEGAFASRTPQYFQGRRVLLIDDVLTTRATVRECARIILSAGAERVCVAALAQGI